MKPAFVGRAKHNWHGPGKEEVDEPAVGLELVEGPSTTSPESGGEVTSTPLSVEQRVRIDLDWIFRRGRGGKNVFLMV